jgi:V8-like Glu-specific endopeptidase
MCLVLAMFAAARWATEVAVRDRRPSFGSSSSGPAAADGRGRSNPDLAASHVGALFHAGGDHFCTGSLVAAPGRDLVVTAAHCVQSGAGHALYSDVQFAPGYRDGDAPYGYWRAGRITVDPRWTASADPDLDVAFVQLLPRRGQRLSDDLDANRIGFGAVPAGLAVQLTGYPTGQDDPLTCVGTLQRYSATQSSIACTGYGDGTSGSPWVVNYDAVTRTGTVIGVIGGRLLGGDTDDVSYSPVFGTDVRQLHLRAATG